MENTEKQKVISRRDFFKSAAKKALPIIAAVALANVYNSANAIKVSTPQDCNGSGCIHGCYGSCENKCSGSCQGNCYNSCKTTCDNSCKGGNC